MLELPHGSPRSARWRGASAGHIADADPGRRHPADGHRRDPGRGAALPQGKKHLGMHTEMFSDGVVELFEAGVDHQRGEDPAPRQDRHLVRARLAQDLRLPRQQPVLEFHPTEYVNDPFIIAQNDKMVAINSALAVDLTGPGLRRLDRHVDLLRLRRPGRLHPRRGALEGRQADHRPAVDRQGRHASRGSSTRCAEAPVSSPPGPTSTTSSPSTASPPCSARACASALRQLIAIAHPDFRDELRAAARRRNLL